jgi:hypothetical protein
LHRINLLYQLSDKLTATLVRVASPGVKTSRCAIEEP